MTHKANPYEKGTERKNYHSELEISWVLTKLIPMKRELKGGCAG